MANRVVRRGRSFAPRGPKRKSQWIGSADQGDVAVGANASVIVQSNAGLANVTIVRTRGLFSWKPSTFSASSIQLGAVGMGIVSDQAFAAGAASIPGPWTDPEWSGWFWWQAFSYRNQFDTAIGQQMVGQDIVVDSKAMRKVEINEVVVMMAETFAVAGVIAGAFRQLVKLP